MQKGKCAIPDCPNNRRSAVGYCSMHYKRWKRNGDPVAKPPSRRNYCIIEGCEKVAYAYGHCLMHHKRLLRHGNPLVTVKPPNGSRYDFIANIARYFDGDECLPWPFKSKSQGRGLVYLPNGTERLASRVLCEMVYGPPPTPRHEAAHSCGKGHEGCVNPKHLRWATPEENQADKIIHGTTNRGERCGSAKLTEDDVRYIRIHLNSRCNKEIASLYGVTDSAIRSIKSRRTWAWLE